MTENEIAETLVKTSTDQPFSRWTVFVSHITPYNTRLDKYFLRHHVGSRNIRSFIEKQNPSIVFCGHVHEARGNDYIGATILVNPDPARYGNYALATFENEIEVEFGLF